MKIMNIGYNQATQQYANNQQNPMAFKACKLCFANEAKPENISTLRQVVGRVLNHIGRERFQHTLTEVNFKNHVKGQPASVTIDMPSTDKGQLQDFVDVVRTRYLGKDSGVTIDLT